MPNKSKKFILWFSEINKADVGLVGGKNASLGEMYQQLTKTGHSHSRQARALMKKWGAINVPNGFAITAYDYRFFIKKAGLQADIKRILKGLDTRDIPSLAAKGAAVRKAILEAEVPPEITKEIVLNYNKLGKLYGQKQVDVAVRSS